MTQEKEVDLRDIALRWAKIAYPLMTHEDQMEAEAFFPELKESEDERIRKQLLNWFKGCHWDSIDDGTLKRDDIIAWLEKQGKQKSVTDFSNLRTWKYIVDAVLTEKDGIGQYLDEPFTEEVAKKLQKRFGNVEQKQQDKSTLEGNYKETSPTLEEHHELDRRIMDAFRHSLEEFFSDHPEFLPKRKLHWRFPPPM